MPSERFTQMVFQTHDGKMAFMTENGVVLDAFAVTDESKNDCVHALTLIRLVSPVMLMDIYLELCPHIHNIYRRADGLPSVRGVPAPARVFKILFIIRCSQTPRPKGIRN
ncbi:unnamed protein product [Dibothriocephalus latus]|uniref:Uncharacterized protein n=1 Tax=Dibothriocephalus latus TaxID=60516 RepID=A0A3P7LJI2_DIBLA|nr:unnamed protein product [Dibothriocephalus latus]